MSDQVLVERSELVALSRAAGTKIGVAVERAEVVMLDHARASRRRNTMSDRWWAREVLRAAEKEEG